MFIALVTFSFPLRIAEAMPEALYSLAIYSPALPRHKKDFVDWTMMVYRESARLLEDFEHDITAIRSRAEYTQEQATKEIAQSINDKKLPGYILDEGEYKYDGNINAVYPVSNCTILSQPNLQSEAKTEVYSSNLDETHEASRVFDYWGEWTSPQGVQWVIVGYREYDSEATVDEGDEGVDVDNYVERYEIGFLSKKQVGFATNEQVRELANAVEYIRIAQEISSAREREITAEYEQQLQQARQQTQQALQQARQLQQQKQYQLPERKSYYCRRCGKIEYRYGDGGPTSGNNACHPHGAKRAGAHDWTRLD